MARPAAITRDMPYEPGHVTLLLVDMQRIWVEPDLDPAYPNATPDDYLYRELRHSNCLRDFSTAARNATLDDYVYCELRYRTIPNQSHGFNGAEDERPRR